MQKESRVGSIQISLSCRQCFSFKVSLQIGGYGVTGNEDNDPIKAAFFFYVKLSGRLRTVTSSSVSMKFVNGY